MAIPPEVKDLVTEAGKAAVLGLATYAANGIRALLRHARTTDQRVTRIEHTVFGVDGDNGMKLATKQADHDIRELREDVRVLKERTA